MGDHLIVIDLRHPPEISDIYVKLDRRPIECSSLGHLVITCATASAFVWGADLPTLMACLFFYGCRLWLAVSWVYNIHNKYCSWRLLPLRISQDNVLYGEGGNSR